MTKLYAVLAVLGFLLPMSQVIPLAQNPVALPALLAQPFANPLSTMFTFDLLVSCAVFWAFLATDRTVRNRWIYVAFTLLVGLSFALPMYLLARERARARGVLGFGPDVDPRDAASHAVHA